MLFFTPEICAGTRTTSEKKTTYHLAQCLRSVVNRLLYATTVVSEVIGLRLPHHPVFQGAPRRCAIPISCPSSLRFARPSSGISSSHSADAQKLRIGLNNRSPNKSPSWGGRSWRLASAQQMRQRNGNGSSRRLRISCCLVAAIIRGLCLQSHAESSFVPAASYPQRPCRRGGRCSDRAISTGAFIQVLPRAPSFSSRTGVASGVNWGQAVRARVGGQEAEYQALADIGRGLRSAVALPFPPNPLRRTSTGGFRPGGIQVQIDPRGPGC